MTPPEPHKLTIVSSTPADELTPWMVHCRALAATALPVRRTTERSVVRNDTVGQIRLVATATDPKLPLPYGSDRSVLLWALTRGFTDGVVAFDSLNDYMRAFDIGMSGREVKRFREGLERINALSLHVELQAPNGAVKTFNTAIFRHAYFPRRSQTPPVPSPQLSLISKYGYELAPDFLLMFRDHGYFFIPLSLVAPLHNAPGIWDLVVFLYLRSRSARTPSRISIREIRLQLGIDDPNPWRTRPRIEKAIEHIRVHFPDFPTHLPEGGDLQVLPWPEQTPTRHRLLLAAK